MTKTTVAQGEAYIRSIDTIPASAVTRPAERSPGGAWIVAHSEKGHHHVLPAGCDVMERTDDVPAGMRILYAIVSEPCALKQEATTPHEAVSLLPGTYEIRIRREYDLLAEQARRVAD